MRPLSTRRAPNHSTATLEMLSTSMTTGKIRACKRPVRSAVAVRSSLAWANRARSSGSRTKARTTRMPAICSRRTRLTLSRRPCMSRNCGTILRMIRPIATTSTGTLTTSSQDRPTSSRSAITRPPTHMIGAATNIPQNMSTTVWTCCTSLVVRVMRDGAPKRATSRLEKVPTRAKTAARTSRPTPMAVRAPK